VPLWPENAEALDAFHDLLVFGPEAGMQALTVRLGPERLLPLLSKLRAAQGSFNEWQAEKATPQGGGK